MWTDFQNSLCAHHKDFHLTYNMLLYYFVKVENPKMLLYFHVERDNNYYDLICFTNLPQICRIMILLKYVHNIRSI